MSKITERAAAPDFQLESGGGPIRLGDFAGKTLVVYFYPKDDTTGCTREAIGFSENARKFRDVPVIGVSKDSIASHDRFKAKYKLKIALASDPEVQTAKDYAVWGEKTLYGRKYMGMERATFLVDAKGVIHSVWRKVKVAGHVEAVLAAVKTLS